VGRRGSGPAFGPVRLELCHVKAFWLLFGLQKVTKEKTSIASNFSRCPASPEAGLQYQFINHSAATPPWTTIFIGTSQLIKGGRGILRKSIKKRDIFDFRTRISDLRSA